MNKLTNKWKLSCKVRCYTRISSPEKSRKNTWKNTIFFHVISWKRLISPISCWYVFALCATPSGWWMNSKAFTILNRKSFFGIFSDCSFKKIMKNPYRLPTVTFIEGEENQNTKRKTESYVFSGFDNGISRGWERQSTTGRFAAGLFWPCTWKISSVGKDQLNNWEFWAHLKTWVESPQKKTHVFTFQCANALYDFYSGLWILSFSFKSNFFVSKGLLCLHDKQNNIWLLEDMKFLFSCSTRHLTRREIPYLRAPMYYSPYIFLGRMLCAPEKISTILRSLWVGLSIPYPNFHTENYIINALSFECSVWCCWQ